MCSRFNEMTLIDSEVAYKFSSLNVLVQQAEVSCTIKEVSSRQMNSFEISIQDAKKSYYKND